MPETTKAPQDPLAATPEMVEFVEKLEAAPSGADKTDATPVKDEAQSKDETGTAEPESAPDAGEPETAPDAEPEKDGGEQTGEPSTGHEWASEDADLLGLAERVESGETTAEDIAILKSKTMTLKGFHRKMTELDKNKKELERKAADGDEYRKLFTDEAEQAKYLAWKREGGSAEPKADDTPEELPEFENDAELIRYIEDRAVDRLRAEQKADEAKELAKASEATEASQDLVERAEAMYARFPDTSEEEYVAACNALGAELKEDGIDPVQHLRSDDRLFKSVKKQIEVQSLRARLESLEGKSRTATRKADRSIHASSPAGTSLPPPEIDMSTAAGRLEATKRDLPGAWQDSSGAPIDK
ncbi:MAG: hypothetical protein GY946_04925 [bacterium]|nr:hypothetical protein [bacterium]